MTQPYPNLGFNPAPGTLDAVTGMQTKLASSAETLEQAYRMVERLRAGVSWEGDAAVAFREQLDGSLSNNLKNARASLLKAATTLGGWQQDLSGFQDRAKTLEGDAKTAHDKLTTARDRERAAQADPDLKLAGQKFATDSELQSAQSRLDRATEALSSATRAVTNAQSDLNGIIKRAHDLAEEHSATARGKARTLRDATDKLAPEEPGWFSEAMDWLSDNLTDVVGAIAAVAGLLALILSGPVGIALFLLVAAAASAATLATRIADPVFRASIADGFTKGEFDADFWSNAVGAAGDALGVVPGAGAVARGVNGAVRSAGAATEALTLGERMASADSKTWLAANRIAKSDNPVTLMLVKGAADPAGAAEVIDFGVSGAGTLTSMYGVAQDAFPVLQNDGVNKTCTAMDAARAGTFDGAGNGSTALKTLKVLINAR
ncbi:hypothetical protein [Actinacidiphila oryziradicis]|uniref:hypothetical protein n=1 Tax=Actinacidiphila oryziradicis TaxID=2571141 RepID=UPI0023F301E1|nr:hypothetical protein [Actinacidiphila oryziradicis]MCW2870351.1 Integral rane protein [Actinacidiphila oryziradicis]